MGGTLQSDLAWPSQGWTSPARDLRLNRSSRSSSRRSKIEITSKMTPGVKERSYWETCEDSSGGSTEPGSGGAMSPNGAAETHPCEGFLVEVERELMVMRKPFCRP